MNLKPKSKKFVLVDVNALVHRAYHAYPSTLSVNGQQINAVYGFTTLLFEVLEKFHPEYVVCCMDVGKATDRLKIYPQYKANRKPMEPELVSQMPIVKEVIKAFNLLMYTREGSEADDLIGTIVNMKNVENSPDLETIIVTGDRDLFQLVDHNTYVYLAGTSFSKSKLFGVSEVKEKMGFGPEFVIDYKALRGDPGDNIPGVKGIGEKSALALIQKYGHLDSILKNVKAEKVEPARVARLINEQVDLALVSQKLATIKTDIKVDFKLENANMKSYDPNALYAVFKKYQFSTLMRRIGNISTMGNFEASSSVDSLGVSSTSKVSSVSDLSSAKPQQLSILSGDEDAVSSFDSAQVVTGSKQNMQSTKPVSVSGESQDFNYILLDKDNIKKFLTELKKQTIFAYDTETDSLDLLHNKLIGMSFSFKLTQSYYLPVSVIDGDPGVFEQLKEVFADGKIKKIGHNLKFDMHTLENAGMHVNGAYFDTMIAAYLLKMGEGSVGLKNLAMEYFGIRMAHWEEVMELAEVKGKMDTVPLDKIKDYAAADADITYRLYDLLKRELDGKGYENMKSLFYDIEMPIVNVLFDIERSGIKLDKSYLMDYAEQLDKQISDLRAQIVEFAGIEFNVNSPRQLGEILYKKMGLTSGRKTGSGALSTDERVLRELRDQHKIIDVILEYREIAKLRSTYTDALIEKIDLKDGRIHTWFNQTRAVTGRLSSMDPNLQNIPVATEMGNKIRTAFVAEKGKVFVSFDYSQQELRLLASVSRDEVLIRNYENNEDVHKLTASKLFEIPMSKVTDHQRSAGKTVNFSIIYGITAFGLSDRLKIPREQAQKFIDKYFEVYPGVKTYFEEMLKDAKKKTFVETLAGRRKSTAGLDAVNYSARRAVEREVINFPLQGGASDMIKIAMVTIAKELGKPKWKDYKMVLQVHDELLFEIPIKGKIDDLKNNREFTEFSSLVTEHMKKANRYKIEMKVDVGVGQNWGNIVSVK